MVVLREPVLEIFGPCKDVKSERLVTTWGRIPTFIVMVRIRRGSIVTSGVDASLVPRLMKVVVLGNFSIRDPSYHVAACFSGFILSLSKVR